MSFAKKTVAPSGSTKWQPILPSGAELRRGCFLDEELGFERWEKCWSDRVGACDHPYPVLYSLRWAASLVGRAEHNRRKRAHRRVENRMLSSFYGE